MVPSKDSRRVLSVFCNWWDQPFVSFFRVYWELRFNLSSNSFLSLNWVSLQFKVANTYELYSLNKRSVFASMIDSSVPRLTNVAADIDKSKEKYPIPNTLAMIPVSAVSGTVPRNTPNGRQGRLRDHREAGATSLLMDSVPHFIFFFWFPVIESPVIHFPIKFRLSTLSALPRSIMYCIPS